MSNFMGPMAPPQAAPQAPQSLEFQTDPNQRQKFRQFMRDRMRPPMPQMPAPMPQPMPTVPAGSYIYPDIDIFGPQAYAAGGVVGGLNDLQQMSGQMVEALNQVVYGGAPSGGGMASASTGPVSSPQVKGGDFVAQLNGGYDLSAPPTYNGNRPILGDPTQPYFPSQQTFDELFELPTIFSPSSSPFEMRIDPIREGDQRTYDASDPFSKFNNAYGFEHGGTVKHYVAGGDVFGGTEDALAEALSNDVGDYAVDDTMTDLSQTDWSGDDQNRVDYGDSEKTEIAQKIGQQINDAIQSNLLSATPAPVPQSFISPNQAAINQEIANQLNTGIAGVSMPSLAGKSATVDLLGNPITIGFEDGGDVPRRTEIRGQDHMLSYITPDEADILRALGGTGEMHNGIPSFAEADGDDDQTGGGPSSGATSGEEDNAGGASDDGGSFSGGNDDPGNDPGDFVSSPNSSDLFDSDEQEEAAFSEAITGIEHQGDDSDGSFAAMVAAEKVNAALDRALANTQAARNQAAINSAMSSPEMMKERTQLQAGLDGIMTKTQAQQNQANGIQQGFFETDLMDELGIGAVSTGKASTKNKDDILGNLLDTFTEAVKNKNTAPSVTVPNANQIRQAIETRNNMIENEVETGKVPSANINVSSGGGRGVGMTPAQIAEQKASYANIGTASADPLGIDYETDYLDENYVGGAPVGPRFGTATGPGRLSSVTPEEMEALRTGNMVQRQMYRQLAGQKAFSNLAGFDPNNVEKGIFDSLLDMTTKPSSAIEVFRTPITEQVGFKSVPTGTFKEGISGVTGMGNTPGVMGGLMQMFGVDPIVYTGDNRFDPNFVDDGGSSDDVILPLEPRVDPIREETDPNMIGSITNGMYAPPAPQPVVVPSTRTGVPTNLQMPVGYGTPQTGAINPYSLAEIQRYQQMLSRLGQGSPIPLAEGGSVLDAAAGKFLEALTAA